nr:multidrug resistance protein MdtN [Klebsiella pneumoniae]
MVAAAPAGTPGGFASSNGRIEATEVDIASKIAGRIDTILVKEGQFVHQGEVLARMDTRVLNEQRLEAAAQIKEAESAVLAARALLDQRQSEMRASEAVVKQRQAELDSTAKRHVRSNTLSQRGAVSAQQLDDDRAAAERPRGAGIGESRSPPPAPPSKLPAPALFRRKPASKPPRRPSGGSSPILTIAS